MDYIEINDQLKLVISELVNLGFKKTVIGKLLLGSSGYAPIMKYLDDESDESVRFGVKPLTKIGTTIGHELKLVYVKKDNIEIINEIENINNSFFAELKDALINYMNSDQYGTRKQYTLTKKRKNEFESVLDEILSTEIFTTELDESKNNDASKLE